MLFLHLSSQLFLHFGFAAVGVVGLSFSCCFLVVFMRQRHAHQNATEITPVLGPKGRAEAQHLVYKAFGFGRGLKGGLCLYV